MKVIQSTENPDCLTLANSIENLKLDPFKVSLIYTKGKIHKAIQRCQKICKNTTIKSVNKFLTKDIAEN